MVISFPVSVLRQFVIMMTLYIVKNAIYGCILSVMIWISSITNILMEIMTLGFVSNVTVSYFCLVPERIKHLPNT